MAAANVVALASLYSNQAGDFSFNEFHLLIADLLCLQESSKGSDTVSEWSSEENSTNNHKRKQIYHIEPVISNNIATLLAQYARVQSELLTMSDFVELCTRLPQLLQSEELMNIGVTNKFPLLTDTDTYSRIQQLQDGRSMQESPWVFSGTNNLKGHFVTDDILDQEDNWQCIDHGDDTGIVYQRKLNGVPVTDKRGLLPVYTVQRMRIFTFYPFNHHPSPPPLLSSVVSSENKVNTGAALIKSNDAIKGSTRSEYLLQGRNEIDDKSINSSNSGVRNDTNQKQLCQSIDDRLASMGWEGVEKGSRGDCFFRCLCGGLANFNFLNSDENALTCRREVIQHMQCNPEDYRDFIPYDNFPDYDSYLKFMSEPYSWVQGGVELLATAEVYNVHIYVIGRTEEFDQIISPKHPTLYSKQIYLAHYFDTHYKLAMPKK